MNRKEKQSKTDVNRKKPTYAKAPAGKVKVHPATIQLLTDASWEFAHAQLWNNISFSKAEIEVSKIYIKEFYQSIPAEKFSSNAASYFSGYCERILLAKKYVSRYAHRYIPHPCIWLDKRNPKGFAGTKSWYKSALQKRKKQNMQQAYLIIPITLGLTHFNSPLNF